MNSYFKDVGEFNKKFGISTSADTQPNELSADVLVFRTKFLLEELAEFCEAAGFVGPPSSLKASMAILRSEHRLAEPNLHDMADALADLVYVALGTAHLMGLPFEEIWREVQRANLSKERASSETDVRSKRRHALDVIKPQHWDAPNHEPAIRAKLAGKN